ncbi:hypothetical protein BO70DRAFT_335548 [Aspergillus heteromorphus CBS 117.55]|uniref:Thioesterase domain-containing protein n=1 Tax=Aspergillus heteromorphus CBS 117.55 TaxID=1448321 RepID=A0A317WAD4_9EURO|nr:uncharacterized protein BO70DRAFT_335548 [Aspergillus heteromorphus CBS 117.55]PWY83494.1 hypothetical protein BO70DRAFT_335548 [Aspergillus heteromorphus CBS 117.55]
MFAFGSRRVLQSRLGLATLQPQALCRRAIPVSRSASTAAPEVVPRPSRWRRYSRYLSIVCRLGFCGVGLFAGWIAVDFVSLRYMPQVPGTSFDSLKLKSILADYESEPPVVKALREDPYYIEADVYGNYTEEEKLQRLSSGPLGGSRGLALQKIFYNDRAKTVVNYAYLGLGLEGWPTIVHGGLLATVMDENLARVAIRHFPERTAVTANLQLQYRRPVSSNKFYTFHATLDEGRSTDRKAWVNGEVRDAKGNVCVEATGLFVVPKDYKLQEVGDRF